MAVRVLAAPGPGRRDAQACCLGVATASRPAWGRGLAGRRGLGTGILFQGLGCPAMRSEGQSGGWGQLCRVSLRSSCALPGAPGPSGLGCSSLFCTSVSLLPNGAKNTYPAQRTVVRIKRGPRPGTWQAQLLRIRPVWAVIPLMKVVLGRSSPRPPGSEGAPLEGVAGRGAPACPRLVRTDAVHAEPGLLVIAYKHLRSSKQREHTF